MLSPWLKLDVARSRSRSGSGPEVVPFPPWTVNGAREPGYVELRPADPDIGWTTETDPADPW